MKTLDTQAEQFLSSNMLRLRITLSDSKPCPWGEGGHHYRVTLSRDKSPRPICSGTTLKPDRLTFDFWDSAANARSSKAPTPYDALACISSDSHCPDTFTDWCSEYGDSEDSIKAKQTWKRCHTFAKRLQAFFTPAELTQLAEIQ